MKQLAYATVRPASPSGTPQVPGESGTLQGWLLGAAHDSPGSVPGPRGHALGMAWLQGPRVHDHQSVRRRQTMAKRR